MGLLKGTTGKSRDPAGKSPVSRDSAGTGRAREASGTNSTKARDSSGSGKARTRESSGSGTPSSRTPLLSLPPQHPQQSSPKPTVCRSPQTLHALFLHNIIISPSEQLACYICVDKTWCVLLLLVIAAVVKVGRITECYYMFRIIAIILNFSMLIISWYSLNGISVEVIVNILLNCVRKIIVFHICLFACILKFWPWENFGNGE